MTIEIVFETHALTEDNEAGIATGWRPGRLSAEGREQARLLGARRRSDRVDAVFASDLGRATETVAIAFPDAVVPVFLDWRLRECDYGDCTGMPVGDLNASRRLHLADPYPGG